MPRSVGITVSAVVVLIGSALTIFFLRDDGFGVRVLIEVEACRQCPRDFELRCAR
jgi:hypothetical protein